MGISIGILLVYLSLVCALPPRDLVIQTDERIYGGENVLPNQYPFSVVSMVNSVVGYYLCGGALISDQFVLTAAHCLYDYTKISVLLVYVGAHDFGASEQGKMTFPFGGNDFEKALIFHDDFDPDTLANNVALIKLTQAVTFSDKIKVINLPPPTLTAKDVTGLTAAVIGWGIWENSTSFVRTPKLVNVTILPPTICNHYYSSQDINMGLCSDGEYAKGACKGDEGSPLFITQDDGSHLLIGIVSFYSSFCGREWPTTYISVAGYVDWIYSRISLIES